ncbi:hypothetical protein [Microvirga pakistanensis]|uniref:hypothetical protein n=1 Tax=Microvirga pakistanensis TaxID=1682650 RepID=UPI00106D3FA0|nr:hypothetical protein [Microvirga pakistanensis]
MVTLFYLEGIARIIVDKDEDSPSAEAAINVGGNGKVFGDKIEWRLRDGKPCAVITRVSTDKGSRLIVTSLDKPARPLGQERTNEGARRAAEIVCNNEAGTNSGAVTSAAIPGLNGPAAEAIRAQIKKEDLSDPEVHVFYGDLTGNGTKDAISFVYSPIEGGNGISLSVWVWYDRNGVYQLARNANTDDIVGQDPRDVKFAPAHISVTTTVLKPGDPRCCPTGTKTFTIVDR